MSDKIINESMRIAGKKIDFDKKIDVEYPFTGEVIGTVPAGNAEHAKNALEIAANYTPKLTRYERQKILQTAAEELVKRKEQISDLITYELGISKQDFSCDLTPHGKARKIFTIREPLTAISAITPFNHPLNMVAHKIAPSIATNNCTVCKQTELTPLTAMVLADVLYESGLPPEMFSVVTGWPDDIGLEMIKNPNIDLITFTGSVGVGKYIAEHAGYKRTVLELGGNDPLIVLNDLSEDDLKKAVELAVTGATKNSGQRCTAVKRILCQNKVADRFVEMTLERAKKIKFGNPMEMDTDLGTVINAQAAELFDKRVSKAAEDGAEILYHPGTKGALLPPIVIDNVNPKSELVMEETFGPIIPIIRVPDEDDEVIKISNSTAFGLSSGVCTNNFMRAKKYIQSLNVGTVNIWEVPGYRIEMSPFGGIKDSGLGYKEGVIEAMKSYTNIKTFSLPW